MATFPAVSFFSRTLFISSFPLLFQTFLFRLFSVFPSRLSTHACPFSVHIVLQLVALLLLKHSTLVFAVHAADRSTLFYSALHPLLAYIIPLPLRITLNHNYPSLYLLCLFILFIGLAGNSRRTTCRSTVTPATL